MIARLASQDPRVPRLMQMTGISYYTAFAILAASGNIDRFRHPDQLAAYGGLVPRQHPSGGRNFYGHIRYLQPQTFVTKLQQWAYRIGRAHLSVPSTQNFVRSQLAALGLDSLAASLTAKRNGRL